jgi:DNA recombination protein RmuC
MEIIFVILLAIAIVLITYIALKLKGNQTSSEVIQGVPEWASQQLNENKTAIQSLTKELQETKTALTQCQLSAATQKATLESELIASKNKLEDVVKLHEQQKQESQQAKDAMRNEFKVLAQSILDEKSKQFKSTNSQELDKLLAPFKQKLEDFEKTVKDNHQEEVKSTTAMMEHIKALQQMNSNLTEQANGLVKALRGDNKTQGNWGEFVLEKALEMSGLTKDKEYSVQNSSTTSSGKRLQPDVIIHLPENKKIIIDSKVSLVAWEAYMNADDDKEAQNNMKALVTSLQNHIKGLSDKDYTQLYGVDTPEFVLLFIPVEAAFMEVTKYDQELYEYAFSRRIILVSTSTLLATLKTIAMAWRQEKQAKNVIEIAEAGGRLYDKFVGLINDIEKLGSQFTTAQNTYNDTMTKLKGRGGLLMQVERLKTLGSKTKKSLDPDLLAEASLDDTIEEDIDLSLNENNSEE